MMKDSKPKRAKCFVVSNAVDPFVPFGSSATGSSLYWKWGTDNLFPTALSLLSRRSTAHRRIINDKADYISGKGFMFDESNKVLASFVGNANGCNESLRQVINKLAFDKALFGNCFLEIVTNHKRSFLSLFHQDASKCRLSKDKRSIILHHNWAEFSPIQAKTLSLYPAFSEAKDGTLRSIIHYKDYEPMFENYGVPPYVAGLGVSSIAYKTDKWNISRLDNSFQLSGVMVLDGGVDNDDEAHDIMKTAETKFAGKPGQVMFVVKNNDGTEGSKFIPISSANEGDWKYLHEQATSDIVVAHSWFRTLSGLDYSNGFSSDRILHEYEVALNTIIRGEQHNLLEPIIAVIQSILAVDPSSLQIINRPPLQNKPGYMRIWEARKNDGLEYDETDVEQQAFIASLNSSKNATNQ